MKIEKLDILGIESLAVLSDDPTVAVVFLHGYGANMHDLFPLWEMWHQDKFNWYFPNGIHSLSMGHYEGRAWFSIDIEELEKAMREGTHRDLGQTVPPELDTTLNQMEHFLTELSKKHSKIILGGFSQGAMCSSHLAMRSGTRLEGIILLSGGLLAESKMPQNSNSVPFYQSHGLMDPILSIDGAKALERKLLSLNFQGKLHPFEGGHEIPPKVIKEVKDFLANLTQ